MAATTDKPEQTTHEATDLTDEDRALPEVSRDQIDTPGRNIVLLSDGTGNSAGKANKTNVWRLYKALDLSDDAKQIATYDDGVGTSGIKVLRIIGGAFGWGLSRNVRDLYRFVCQHYQNGQDRIYIFGFSRGAFTARTLAGMIAACGILDPQKSIPRSRWSKSSSNEMSLGTAEGLNAAVKLAYRSYRRTYVAPVARLVRRARDLLLGKIPKPEAFREQYSRDDVGDGEHPVRIKLVGVWDTVDAVGLPIDELSTMIDRIFYPHRFPNQELSGAIDHALHAIAIDDERHTFHPVLWTERDNEHPERITQVWFSGMHSNVGGGYPDDDLAHVSLHWMINAMRAKLAEPDRLHLDADAVKQIQHRSQAQGKMYASRSGAAVYYRYKPRKIAELCDDEDGGVCIDVPKLHESVVERIKESTAGYAPAGLPETLEVVDDDCAPVELDEDADERAARAERLDRAQSHILWNRIFYYALLFATLAIVLLPYFRPGIPGAEIADAPVLGQLLTKLFAWITPFLPGFASYWTDSWAQSPYLFAVLALVFGLCFWRSRRIEANKQRLAEAAWWHLRKPKQPTPAVAAPRLFERFATRLRSSAGLARLHRFNAKWFMPSLFAVVCLYVAAGATYRLVFHWPTVGGGVCGKSLHERTKHAASNPDKDQSALPKTIEFDTSNPCVATGVTLYRGQSYNIQVKEKAPWFDGRTAAGIGGLSRFLDRFTYPFPLAVPARRHLSTPWFALVGEIGLDSGETFPINREDFDFKPRATGKLYLYVNDAVNSRRYSVPVSPGESTSNEHAYFCAPGRRESWYGFYCNNKGKAEIKISAGQ